MHFDDEVNAQTQKPEIIEFYNQTKSGVDTVDQLVGTYNVATNTRRWPMVIFYMVLNVGGINGQCIHMLNKNVKIRRRMFLKNLSLQLIADQIKRRSEMTSGIHRPLHLRLHTLQHSEDASSSRNPELNVTDHTRKRCSSCYASKTTRLSKYFCKNCKTFLCLEHSTIVCICCFNRLTNPNPDDSD